MNWLRKIFRSEPQSIPQPLWQAAAARLPFLGAMSPEEWQRLKALAELLLDRKTFTGAAGLEMSDDIAVLIAIQAALPVLNLTPDLYDDMAGVIVYPSSFIIPYHEVDEAGVVHEWRAPVSGEALDAGGAVVLSWEDVEEDGVPGYNVVIHEFAHKIDMAAGGANGCPPFLAGFHDDIDPARWRRVFSAAYADFRERVEALDLAEPGEHAPEEAWERHDALIDLLPLDPYAVEHPAEFFAVATEAFFVRPHPLAEVYPEAYRLLASYYRQDPAARAGRITPGKTR
ncbi:zinc-dependent peptidase [Noviherbaspirillum humi]|nr:M90 family metallopeptidase [Noviherbaspirillum humi]